MKILLVNWSWYPSGGDWTYIANIKKLYEANGFETIPFSTYNKKNEYSIHSKNFVHAYDFKVLNKNKTLANGIRAIKTSIISKNALKKLDQILEAHDIKIAHLHNIHHYLTPAIIEKFHSKGIKIIWSLHDYKIICPENSFVSNGKICEKCIDGSFYHCALNKCKKNSYLASALAAFDAYYYNSKKIYDLVDAYLCPSSFLKNKFIQAQFDEKKLTVTNLCYDIDIIDKYRKENPVSQKEKYIFYIGRIEEIKGIKTLIKAVEGTTIQLKIAGSGPAELSLKIYISEQKISNVVFLGFQEKQQVFNLINNSLFGVCPSEWYENFPFSIAETLLFSKPVVGSNIGGIPELIIDNKTGLLFEPKNILELREKLLLLWNDEEYVTELGRQAREHAYMLYNFENHWKKLNAIIHPLIQVPNEQ